MNVIKTMSAAAPEAPPKEKPSKTPPRPAPKTPKPSKPVPKPAKPSKNPSECPGGDPATSPCKFQGKNLHTYLAA